MYGRLFRCQKHHPPSGDNQKYLQILPSVPWQCKIAPCWEPLVQGNRKCTPIALDSLNFPRRISNSLKFLRLINMSRKPCISLSFYSKTRYWAPPMCQVSWIQWWMWQSFNSRSSSCSSPSIEVTSGSSVCLLPPIHTPQPILHSIHSNHKSHLEFVRFSPFPFPLSSPTSLQSILHPVARVTMWNNKFGNLIRSLSCLELCTGFLLHLGENRNKFATVVYKAMAPILPLPTFVHPRV